MVTIKDVAREAGVSIATVSRVFNNVGLVNSDTRHRVQQVARQLKYVPNSLGRSLSTRKTDAIGLLLPDLFGEFFSEVIRGCDQTAQKNRYHLLVSSSHNNRAELDAALKMMRARVDGLIIMSPHIDAHTLEENLPHSLPVVLLNCNVNAGEFDSLSIDNFGGAYQMMQHLQDHGHRRIAMIKGTDQNVDAAERLRGYRSSIEQGGAERDAQLELGGNFSESAGYDAAVKALEISPRPTAIFAANDSMAIGALSALREKRIRVPQDMALVGFDDIPVAPYLSPSLTSVRFGINNLGVIAVQTLLHAVREKNKHHKQQVVLPTTLTLRESCGCTQ